MHRKVVLSLAILLCLTAAAQATLTITVGDHNLLPNTAGQIVPIQLNDDTGGEALQGIAFRAQLDDGVSSPVVMSGQIAGVGMLFEFNNSGVNDAGSPPGLVDLQTTTAAGFEFTSLGDNLLGFLIFDTTGVLAGTWPLTMSETDNGTTDTGGGPDIIFLPTQTFGQGSITIIPEPSSVVLGLFAMAGLGAVAIRKRRARRA